MNKRLLAGVLAAPERDEPRLVYSDWLIEQGDPLGAFIRLQCEHAAGQETPASMAEEANLFQEYGDSWFQALGLNPREGIFHRGFLRSVEVPADRAEAMAPLLRQQPVEKLRLIADLSGNDEAVVSLCARLKYDPPMAFRSLEVDRRGSYEGGHIAIASQGGCMRVVLPHVDPGCSATVFSLAIALLQRDRSLDVDIEVHQSKGAFGFEPFINELASAGPFGWVEGFSLGLDSPEPGNWSRWVCLSRLHELLGAFPALKRLSLPMAEIDSGQPSTAQNRSHPKVDALYRFVGGRSQPVTARQRPAPKNTIRGLPRIRHRWSTRPYIWRASG